LIRSAKILVVAALQPQAKIQLLIQKLRAVFKAADNHMLGGNIVDHTGDAGDFPDEMTNGN
jgi:hypothetical protein